MNDVMQLSLYQVIALLVSIGGALIGIYTRFNNQMALLEARVVHLENDQTNFQTKLEEISKGVSEILLILAENQIRSKS
jgi:hypothetical protein